MPTRNIKLLSSLDALQAGDVVLFRTVYRSTLAQQLIGFYQSLTRQKHGHYDTVHAGICLGHDENGPIIAHVTGENYFSYVKESLIQSNLRDKENRPLLVYRHKDKAIASTIAALAAEVEKQTVLPKWEFSAALKVLFPKTEEFTKIQAISQSTFCSKFTIEILQQATGNTDSYLAIDSTNTPKALEAALYNNNHYDLLLHTGSPKPDSKKGIDPYEVIYNTVNRELHRLSRQKQTHAVHQKYIQLRLALFRHTSFLDENSLDRAQQLLANVMPILSVNTGWGISTPTSYKNVAAEARKLGIFRWNTFSVRHETRSVIFRPICGKPC